MGSKLATIQYQLRYGQHAQANQPDTSSSLTDSKTDDMADHTNSLSVHPAPGENSKNDASQNGAATNGHALDDLGKRNYIRWDTPGVEVIPEGEREDILAVAKQFNDVQRAMWDLHRHCYSGTHARTHGVVRGTFTVHDDLPPHLRQGPLFDGVSNGKEFPVVARYSTEPGDPSLDDRLPTPRGFAMKLFGVNGEMLDGPGKDLPTHDIEFNSTPALDLATAKVTREIVDLRMCHGLWGDDIEAAVKKRDDGDLQMGRYQVRNTHLSSTRQYSQTPYRFGDYVFKYCLVPSGETQRKMYEETVRPDKDDRDVLHKWLGEFHRSHDAEYLYQVQLLENLDDQPVEYAGKAWDPEKYPWQTVATVRFPKQESFDYERKAFWEDHIRVDPWHGLKAYQPLGGSNRLRKIVYPASSSLRRKMNGRKEIHIKTPEEFPA